MQAGRSGSTAIPGERLRISTHWRGRARCSSRAYCNSPLCTPSRQSLITGKLPHAIGVTQLPTRLSDDVLTLGEWLRDLDYADRWRSARCTSTAPRPTDSTVRIDTPDWEREPARSIRRAAVTTAGRGGRSSTRPESGSTPTVRPMGLPSESMQSTFFVDRAIEFLKGKHDRPVCHDRQLLRAPQPVPLSRRLEAAVPASQFPVPPVSEQDRRRAARDLRVAVRRRRARNPGRLLHVAFVRGFPDRAADRGARSRPGSRAQTLVVYVGDNGYMLGQHGRFEKHCFYEPAVRIPMIMRWPGHIESGRRITDLVEMVDVMPTVLHLMNLPVPPDLQGIDLVPLLEEKPGAQGA